MLNYNQIIKKNFKIIKKYKTNKKLLPYYIMHPVLRYITMHNKG